MTTTDMKKPLGLYIHIPFCKRKCLYCDFCSVSGAQNEYMEHYVDSLVSCISSFKDRAGGYEVDTIYIGGGTPTVLDAHQIESLLSACRSSYNVSSGVEISCECNPATGGECYFSEIRGLGINRLSIGLQSANDEELTALGRVHSYADFVDTFSAARRAGFENLSLDLMYGIPHQTIDSFSQTLDKVLDIQPEHISAYCLKVEENTPFGKMGEALILPDDDISSDMYELCCERLGACGYGRYEISNFAKGGRESRHNLGYWKGKDYLGFGAAAHSYFEGERFAYSRDIDSFVRGEFLVSERETIEEKEKMLEYVMLRMRLSEGISKEEFRAMFGRGLFDEFRGLLRFIPSGHVVDDGDRVAFSDTGVFVSSYILSEILDFS